MIEIPGYTVDKEIGHGGMATVYLGIQDMLKREVALKVMLPEMVRDTNFRKSFMSEGEIIASLDHPNIVRIHDIGIVDETILYMAMEHLSGKTLKEKLIKGKVSFPEAFVILKQVASGLAYAHDKGYIHRDIKPGNILFRENGTAVITDFGIAKLQDTSGELTRMGYTMGTVQYMSPEQVVTTDLDHRSDIYSLGLIFYEMLTGLKAFKAETTIQAIHQHTTLPPPTLEGEYAYLQAVIDKVLAKDPENRYQHTDDFVKAVSEADPLDKTVIHRIQNDDDDKTQIFIPEKVQEIPSNTKQQLNANNKKSKLLPLSLAAAAIVGVVTFGAIQYSATDTIDTIVDISDVIKPIETSTVKLVEAPVKEVVSANAIPTKIDVVTKPELDLKNKKIGKIYQPKSYQLQIEKELDQIVKSSIEVLALAPNNKKAQQVINSALVRYHSLAIDLVKSMDLKKAASVVDKGLKISGSTYEPLVNLKVSLESKNRKLSKAELKSVRDLNKQAETHQQAGRYVLPKGQNAMESYQDILTIDPHNVLAIKEMNSLVLIFEDQVKSNLNGNKHRANEFLNQALAISPLNQKLIQLQNQIR